MKKRTPKEQTIFEAKKFARTIIRTKHSILADRELNEVLPALEDTVFRAISEGRSWRLDVEKLLALPESS